MVEMLHTELNDVKFRSMRAVLDRWKKVDCVIHDDACHLKKSALARSEPDEKGYEERCKEFKEKLLFWIIDWFHARNHKCKGG